jgi:tagatose 1,6-diphosphate aldolase
MGAAMLPRGRSQASESCRRTNVKLTPGKLAGLKAVSNERGVIAAAAMDQRGSLKKALGAKATEQDLIDFKIAVSEVLTRYASAILLDPEWGLPAAEARNSRAGLLLAYEKTGYDKQTPGRLPDLLDVWSVRRLKQAGADCIKILLYYSPTDPKDINELKHAWTERIGDECVSNDIPFFLEIIGYEEGLDEKSLAYAKKKPEIVMAYMSEFSKPKYNVDVLKLEVPINMKFVEGTKSFKGEKAYSKTEAQALFRKSAEATDKPYIYLSAGVSNAEFSETLELVGESGVKYNGVLCGRATWADGVPIFAEKGLAAFRAWLEVEGVKNIENVNAGLKAASPWYPIYGV